MILLPRQRVSIDRNGSRQFTRLALPAKTAAVILRVARESSGQSVRFPSGSLLRSRLIVRADADDFVCDGSAVGGSRRSCAGSEVVEYALRYTLPWGFFGQRAGLPRRLGEHRSSLDVMLELLLDGDAIDTEFMLEATEADAPRNPFHSSVAFDAATDAVEIGGDAVLSLSHTATGSDRAAFAYYGHSDSTPGATSTMTYGGSGMTEMWDGTETNAGHSGHYIVAPATGSQTVTGTLAGSNSEKILSVVSMTGVDQTTPVGTHQTNVGTTVTSLSVTVTGVGVDDLVVSGSYAGQAAGGSSMAPGAGTQTERTDETFDGGGFTIAQSTSTQLGSDGGGMSWNFSTTANFGSLMGAVAFKPSVGGGAPANYPHVHAQRTRRHTGRYMRTMMDGLFVPHLSFA